MQMPGSATGCPVITAVSLAEAKQLCHVDELANDRKSSKPAGASRGGPDARRVAPDAPAGTPPAGGQAGPRAGERRAAAALAADTLATTLSTLLPPILLRTDQGQGHDSPGRGGERGAQRLELLRRLGVRQTGAEDACRDGLRHLPFGRLDGEGLDQEP
jgi:hypothetical protein